MGKILAGNGQIDGHCSSVFRDHGAFEQRVSQPIITDLDGLFTCCGHLFHQPLKANLAQSVLQDIVYIIRGNDIPAHYSALRIVRIYQGGGKFAQHVNLLQGLWIKDPVRVFFIDHAQDNHVMEVKFFLGLIMEDADKLFV